MLKKLKQIVVTVLTAIYCGIKTELISFWVCSKNCHNIDYIQHISHLILVALGTEDIV